MKSLIGNKFPGFFNMPILLISNKNINNYKDFSYKFNEDKTMDKNKRKAVKPFFGNLKS